jgi:hypothetical protein
LFPLGAGNCRQSQEAAGQADFHFEIVFVHAQDWSHLPKLRERRGLDSRFEFVFVHELLSAREMARLRALAHFTPGAR